MMSFLGFAIQHALNSIPAFRALGCVSSVFVNTDSKEINLDILFTGETSATACYIHYDIFGNDILIQKITFNKKWINALSDYYFSDAEKRRIPLKGGIFSSVVKFIL